VLDEATSNIDAEAEKAIQEALEVLIRGRTTIAIAHRLSTLRNADRILVFDRGQLVEQGSHAELLSSDGVYARLVRIQTQVSKDPNVDRLLEKMNGTSAGNADGEGTKLSAEAAGAAVAVLEEPPPEEPGGDGADGSARRPAQAPRLRWLDPYQARFYASDDGRGLLCLEQDDAPDAFGVFVLRTFPATHPERYLSVRTWNADGEDVEVGLIGNLAEWPLPAQALVRQSLERRYLLRRITAIHSLKLAFGFLEFDVETDAGRTQFLLRWTQSQALDFADNGKLLIDTEENRYVVPNVEQLSKRDQERFLQYVYW
jgi:hypothetical protein